MRSLERRPGVTSRVQVHEYADGRIRRHEDRLASEEPLEVRLAWPGAGGRSRTRRVAVTMRTPGHDFELAAGLLHGEGVLEAPWLRRVAYCTDAELTREQELNVVTVEIDRPPVREPATRYEGPAAAASACGVCGTESIDEVLALCEVRRPAQHPVVPTEVLHAPRPAASCAAGVRVDRRAACGRSVRRARHRSRRARGHRPSQRRGQGGG